MVKILYGVAGEGMGHAIRSRAVIEFLQKNHEVKVVSAARSYHYLSQFFDVEEIDYFKIVYRNNTAANVLTVANNIWRFPLIAYKGLRIGRIIRSFKPDIIITDFEPLVDYYALFKDIPVISIDNQHVISDAEHGDMVKRHWIDKLIALIIIKLFIVRADRRFVTTFFRIPSMEKKEDTQYVPPLLRKELAMLKTEKKNHILVYQTSTSNSKLLEILTTLPEQFIVYGFYKAQTNKNVQFKNSGEKEFYEDLRTCKAVITNGGFTLMTEALYLHKPILALPVEKQFEQILNALYLEKEGYGMCAKKTTKKAILIFLKNIGYYEKQVRMYRKYNPEIALRKIEQAVKSLSSPPATSRAHSSKHHRDSLLRK